MKNGGIILNKGSKTGNPEQAYKISRYQQADTVFKMEQPLQDIFTLEEAKAFDDAFEAYDGLYNRDRNNYEVWKHFYFFLWIALEDAKSSFHDKVNLRHLLQVMFDEGKRYLRTKQISILLQVIRFSYFLMSKAITTIWKEKDKKCS